MGSIQLPPKDPLRDTRYAALFEKQESRASGDDFPDDGDDDLDEDDEDQLNDE